jgi:hypothetical protein
MPAPDGLVDSDSVPPIKLMAESGDERADHGSIDGLFSQLHDNVTGMSWT